MHRILILAIITVLQLHLTFSTIYMYHIVLLNCVLNCIVIRSLIWKSLTNVLDDTADCHTMDQKSNAGLKNESLYACIVTI